MIFFAKENAPVFKRYFLILGIIFSFLISFLKFDLQMTSEKAILPATVSNQMTDISIAGSEIFLSSSPDWDVKSIIPLIYLSVVLLLSIRYVLNIRRLIKSGKKAIRLNGYNIVILKGNATIYSFLNTIYINEKDYNNGTINKEILIHELTHIKQKHSIDILFIEFLQVIFWFNPLLILFKKEIKLNHEYLADNGVINSDIDVIDYQYFMLNSASRDNSSYLASSFNYSFIKKRIIMLKKEKSSTRLFLKGITISPLILLIAIVFTFSSKAMAADTNNWWEPILKKHNLEVTSYTNIGDVFEMGDNNSIHNNICDLTNATMIIKGKNEEYLIIQADRIIHNIKTGALKIESGILKRYSTMNLDVSKPNISGSGSMEINLNDIIKSNLFSKGE